MKFNRGYLQDEVREVQTEMVRTQIAEQRLNIGLWTPEEAGRYLNIDEDIVKEAQKNKQEEIKSGMLNQNLLGDKDVMRNPDQKQKASVKKETQNNNQLNAGGKKINP
jgi:hypothetical protein